MSAPVKPSILAPSVHTWNVGMASMSACSAMSSAWSTSTLMNAALS
eukprot:CAMPEP_0175544770 /NCGR_PEP_ID=MMETSP0096-20121207/28943_1 /TAXON_ID=311494 /ORGANISM="Alexandrium monilatum, Strain CCMP3105" /LENGTH=45 /DNA_ID= /DNA_START= /DNA_END= /DNA_ORIENTATION=